MSIPQSMIHKEAGAAEDGRMGRRSLVPHMAAPPLVARRAVVLSLVMAGVLPLLCLPPNALAAQDVDYPDSKTAKVFFKDQPGEQAALVVESDASKVKLWDFQASLAHHRAILDGTTPAPVSKTAVADVGLTEQRYLNLSKNIAGALRFEVFDITTGTGIPTPNPAYDCTSGSEGYGGQGLAYSVYVRVEVFANDVLLGGQEVRACPGQRFKNANFHEGEFSFPPEVRSLPAAALLKARVSLVRGAVELYAKSSSYIQYDYYTYDPYSFPVIRNGSSLQSVREGSNGAEVSSAPSAGVLAIGPALVAPALFPSLAGRRRKVFSFAGLSIVGLFAGCSARPPEDTLESSTGEGSPIISTTVNECLECRILDVGEVRGVIRDGDAYGGPLRGARISIPGTHIQNQTDAQGRYALEKLHQGTYPIRIDAGPAFSPINQTVAITSGVTLWLNLTVYRPAIGCQGCLPHDHDAWGSATEMTISTGTATLSPSDTPRRGGEPRDASSNAIGSAAAESYYTGGLSSVFELDTQDNIVFPGSTKMEVRLTWHGEEGLELGLSFFPAGRSLGLTTPSYSVLPRAKNVPSGFAFFPNLADVGHARLSAWAVRVWAPYYDAAPDWFRNAQRELNVDYTVKVFKGILPLENQHHDAWEDNTTLTLLPKTLSAYSPASPAYGTGFMQAPAQWNPSTRSVPMGSASITGRMEWITVTLGLPADPNIGLVPYVKRPGASEWALPPGLDVSQSLVATFRIPVDASKGETDSYYATGSQWQFGWGFDPIKPAGVRTATAVYLTLSAEKDPTFIFQDQPSQG